MFGVRSFPQNLLKYCKNGFSTSSKTAFKVIDGKAIAKEIQKDLEKQVESIVAAGYDRPKLVAILVGNNPASETYVARKIRTAESIGIESECINLKENVSQRELISHIEALNANRKVDGIIVQLPLPEGLGEREVCCSVSPRKDVDGFHLENMGKLSLDIGGGLVPATALAVRELIVRSGTETFGKNAVVVGRSKHVGLPIALLLHGDSKIGAIEPLDMTTTICHRNTPMEELKRYTRTADVVVMAAGVPGLLTKDMVKPGACVIDVGITRVKTENGRYKLRGDVDYEAVKEIAGSVTPVPGGVGPMTVIMLMKNTVFAAAARNGFADRFSSTGNFLPKEKKSTL